MREVIADRLKWMRRLYFQMFLRVSSFFRRFMSLKKTWQEFSAEDGIPREKKSFYSDKASTLCALW